MQDFSPTSASGLVCKLDLQPLSNIRTVAEVMTVYISDLVDIEPQKGTLQANTTPDHQEGDQES